MDKFYHKTWFRCLSVLLLIAVIAGGLLAILNNVLYVSPDERTDRAIKKIYGTTKEFSIVLDTDYTGTDATVVTTAVQNEYGEIDKIYYVDFEDADNDGIDDNLTFDALYKSTGNNGYKGGTITLWIVISYSADNTETSLDETDGVISKVILESYEKQTLMSKLGGDFYSNFTDVTADYQAGDSFFSPSGDSGIANPVTGATKSATAACNAVDCVIEYVWGN